MMPHLAVHMTSTAGFEPSHRTKLLIEEATAPRNTDHVANSGSGTTHRARVEQDGATRLTAILTEAFALAVATDPLDSRGTQLRSLHLSLDNLADALRAELAAHDASLADIDADPRGDHWLARMLAEIERLAALACNMPAVDAGGTAEAPASSI